MVVVRDQESVLCWRWGAVHDIKDDGRVSGLHCWMGDDTITKNGNI